MHLVKKKRKSVKKEGGSKKEQVATKTINH